MISLKKANFSEIEFLWYLRNQPDVYRYFKEKRKVSWQEHINWIMPIIMGISQKDVFVIKKIDISAGQVRINYKNFDISISILKEFRGQGIAAKALALAKKEMRKQKKLKEITAEIHIKNQASVKLFERLGFKMKAKKGNWLKYIFKL